MEWGRTGQANVSDLHSKRGARSQWGRVCLGDPEWGSEWGTALREVLRASPGQPSPREQGPRGRPRFTDEAGGWGMKAEWGSGTKWGAGKPGWGGAGAVALLSWSSVKATTGPWTQKRSTETLLKQLGVQGSPASHPSPPAHHRGGDRGGCRGDTGKGLGLSDGIRRWLRHCGDSPVTAHAEKPTKGSGGHRALWDRGQPPTPG